MVKFLWTLAFAFGALLLLCVLAIILSPMVLDIDVSDGAVMVTTSVVMPLSAFYGMRLAYQGKLPGCK